MKRGGFSLIEVLVALVIFTVGATSVLALFAAAAASHKRSVDRTRASMVAEEIISEVQARYFPGTELDDLERSLLEEIPEAIDGYQWSVILMRPGEEGAGGKGKARKARPVLLVKGAVKGVAKGEKPASASKSPARKSAAETAAKSGKAKSETKGKAKGTEKSAVPEKAKPSSSVKEVPPEASWTEEELIVRVSVRWAQSGRTITENFDTLLLPRPAPEEGKAGSKAAPPSKKR